MTDLVVLVPMLGRAAQVGPLVESLKATAQGARILWLCSAGDVDVLDEVTGHGQVIVLPRRTSGDYAHKVNVGVLNSSEPLIFCGAIDIRFRTGWLDACRAELAKGYEVIGTNDLANPRTARGHSTHTLVTRNYAQWGLIDGLPGLLHEGYAHEYVDDELVGTAIKRGVYAHAPNAIVEHLHPMAGTAPMDEIYAGQQDRMRVSAHEYRRRRRLWV